MPGPMRPLDGITVLDLSRYLPGPFLTRILADLGARVIKVEAPRGDALRFVPPCEDGVGASYASLNAGKDSIAVDLKKPEGTAFVLELARRSDVYVEAFRPGVMARLGLAWEVLAQANPELIGVSLSGYGQTSSRSQVAGHDLNYLAVAGILGLTGPAGGPPQVPGVQLADVGGGSLPAAIGVLAALLERQRTGVGRHLDISLTRGAFGVATLAVAAAAAGAEEPRGAGMLTGGAPSSRCYETADGRFMSLSALEPRFFATVCGVLGVPELASGAFAQGEEAVVVAAGLAAAFKRKTQAGWVAALAGLDTCCEAVRTPAEALADPDLAPLVSTVDGRRVVHLDVGVPPVAPERGVPPLGADGLRVARELGVPEGITEAARRSGALHLPEESR